MEDKNSKAKPRTYLKALEDHDELSLEESVDWTLGKEITAFLRKKISGVPINHSSELTGSIIRLLFDNLKQQAVDNYVLVIHKKGENLDANDVYLIIKNIIVTMLKLEKEMKDMNMIFDAYDFNKITNEARKKYTEIGLNIKLEDPVNSREKHQKKIVKPVAIPRKIRKQKTRAEIAWDVVKLRLVMGNHSYPNKEIKPAKEERCPDCAAGVKCHLQYPEFDPF